VLEARGDGSAAADIPPLLAQIRQHVATAPNAAAVVDGGVTLTYRELWDRALALAESLRDIGCGRESLVALCEPRSAELVVGALGIAAAGAAFVALDPATPAHRLQQMIDDSAAQAMVAGSVAADLSGPTVVAVPPIGARPRSHTEAVTPAPDDLAYVVYTSGSTGRPKGVMIEQAGLANLSSWHRRAFDVTAADRTTQIASPSFDASIWEVWPCLAAGACLYVVPEAVKTDPGALRDWLVAEGITIAFLPTPLAAAVMQLEWPESAALRLLLTGGDMLHQRPSSELRFTVVNNYGLSETTVVSTSGVVSAEGDTPPDIGAAIDGVCLSVVDAEGHPVPDGDAGELLIAGVSVARGYVGAADLTAERFSTSADGVRQYRTGDLVRRSSHGTVDYLGRIDDQVQIRGLRVEPGEIAAVLEQHPAVSASAVVAAGAPEDPRLVGFVVPAGDAGSGAGDIDGLFDYLGARLPAQMVPTDLVTVVALPLTASGKIDRAALLAQLDSTSDRGVLTEPTTDLERIIADIVAERLGLAQVGTDENFFLLGGHSMLGAQLAIRINERFGIEMTLRSLFEGPTVAEMAAEVERQLLAEIDAMSDESVLQAVRSRDDS
jgi:amino acid adenylation domain-containing protein